MLEIENGFTSKKVKNCLNQHKNNGIRKKPLLNYLLRKGLRLQLFSQQRKSLKARKRIKTIYSIELWEVCDINEPQDIEETIRVFKESW